MSPQRSNINATGEPAENLGVMKEEHSPPISFVQLSKSKTSNKEQLATNCMCPKQGNEQSKTNIDSTKVEKLLLEKEEALKANFKEQLKTEIDLLKERADFILLNEQIRASHMLREAHRERQEKILALQTQLECKNLAGLMYIVCSERRKCKMEKLKMTEEYTNYIFALKEILKDAQGLILHLSKGYKTAARVDHEWRQKMANILAEFQMFVHDYAKGTPESDQFFFDIPALMKTEASVVDDPCEDPCESKEELQEREEVLDEEEELKKCWFDRMDENCRPFVVFGDMDGFKPARRREVLKAVKAAKTAPRKWKEYVFNNMHTDGVCSNDDAVKHAYLERLPDSRWECSGGTPDRHNSSKLTDISQNMPSRRDTVISIDRDIRGNMGSILKMITSIAAPKSAKALLLGARDSMEIASTTKLREKNKPLTDRSKVVIKVGSRRPSVFDGNSSYVMEEEIEHLPGPRAGNSNDIDNVDREDDSSSAIYDKQDTDPLIIQHEKICPVDKCQRMHMNSFVRSLPPYMKASPFTHFEKTYEQYETCTPEQLEILQKRIEKKKRKEKADLDVADEDPLQEWTPGAGGVGVQTSDASLLDLPPCTCRAPHPSVTSSEKQVFNLSELVPVKMALDQIERECFYDSTIDFDRFKLIGQQSSGHIVLREDNRKVKLTEVTKVLRDHPSLLEIFQANTN